MNWFDRMSEVCYIKWDIYVYVYQMYINWLSVTTQYFIFLCILAYGYFKNSSHHIQELKIR